MPVNNRFFIDAPFESYRNNFFKMIGAASSRPSTRAFNRALGLLPAVTASFSVAHPRPLGHKTTAGIWIQFPHFDHMVNTFLIELGL